MKKGISYANLTVAIVALVIMIASGGFVASQMYIKSKYPLEYKEEIIKYSKEYDLDPVLVASVICRESRFRLKAKSPAGARGLMQIMPDTGK
ncbi:MAG: transglycosylase SLT domain-containing protein [Clostridia bacterium]|nr:transglycosylase SLT domain-containing protein [Clostridia bacterium]